MVPIKRALDILATGVALLGIAPVVPFLDPVVLALAGAAVFGGAWCDRRGRHPLTPLPATVLALAAVAWYALQVRHAAEVVAPAVNALVVLLAIRLVMTKQARDYLQIFVLALFILAGSSLLSLEAGFVVYLVLLVFAVTVSLVLLTVFVTDPRLAMPRRDLARLVRVALVMPAVSLVLMLGFFVVLPRTASPLWNFLNPAGEAVAGLAESVSPGAFARLSTVRALAFRAEGPELPPEERYWRAVVLNQPQEGHWVRAVPPAEGAVRPGNGRPVTVTIYPEPRTDRYLVTLERPLLVSGRRVASSPDQVYQTTTGNDRRFRYTVQAIPGAELRPGRSVDRAFYLTVPEQVSPRMAAVAAGIAGSGGSTARLAALAEFFRERRLTYAQDDLPGGPDPIDAFLFETRRGYCEFFASAYITLARLAGVPARLVGGYYGGEYNALGGYYLVTDDTAHVWAEILTDDGKWERVDPSQWAENAGAALGAARAGGLSPWQRLTDTLNYYWIQGVVVFDLAQQLAAWRVARDAWREFRPGSLWSERSLQVLALAVTGGVLLGVALRRSRRRRSPEARLLAALHARARARLGTDVAPETLGLSDLAERLASPACREFAAIYQGAVFRDRTLTAAEVARLRKLLREI